MRAIWLFFLVDRKWIFYETELKKNIEVWHSFGKWPHLHKLTFCVSVLLLIIKSSQLAREKRFRYCKIRNYRYTKVGLNWLLKSLNASLTSTVNMAFVRRLISIPSPPSTSPPQQTQILKTWSSITPGKVLIAIFTLIRLGRLVWCAYVFSSSRRTLTESSYTPSVVRRKRDVEQYTRKHSLEIHGIAETADEDIAENVVKLGKAVNVHISPSDIDICHRMGPRNSSGPRPIIVRFKSHKKKTELY